MKPKILFLIMQYLLQSDFYFLETQNIGNSKNWNSIIKNY